MLIFLAGNPDPPPETRAAHSPGLISLMRVALLLQRIRTSFCVSLIFSLGIFSLSVVRAKEGRLTPALQC